MDVLGSLSLGFHVALAPSNLLFCLVGVIIGTLVGVLPGIGPVGAMALLLPATYGTSLTSSLILLAGIYYGAMYGGSTTSILVNIPGEAASVVTCIDGYQMARKGRAGAALGISAIGSWVGGTLSVVGLMLVAKPLATAALSFGPPEYFALMAMGLVILTYLTQGSMVKSLMMALVGILIGSVGLDMIVGIPRFTFGIGELSDGVGIIPVVMGLFGIAEVFSNLETVIKRQIIETEIRHIWPTVKDYARVKWTMLRGTVIGFVLGVLPGGGGILASFLSYAIEKKLSKEPERFGQGAIEGVAGPETANNAAAGGALIPLLSLGIPPNVVMAMLFSAMVIHGMQPGPLLMKTTPDLFWGLVASMYVGNVLLVLLNLPLIGVWVQLLRIPYRILMPLILLFCLIGAYSLNNSTFDVSVMVLFGGMGYLMRKFGYEAAPLVLAFIMGPLLENNLRQSLLMSDGSFTIFVSRPISAVGVTIAFLLLLSNLVPFFKKRRSKVEEILKEE
jgi:putative tricarboxylic transport membrane protein